MSGIKMFIVDDLSVRSMTEVILQRVSNQSMDREDLCSMHPVVIADAKNVRGRSYVLHRSQDSHSHFILWCPRSMVKYGSPVARFDSLYTGCFGGSKKR